MTSLETLLVTDRENLWHPYASITQPPPVNMAVSAQGTKIRFADGLEVIDAVSSWWCVAHGHNHPAIVQAIQEQAEKMTHVMFAGMTHEPAINLCQELKTFLPASLNKIFLADSGSIAVECAAKMAVQYQLARGNTSRTRLAALTGGYHGDTLGTMALSDPNGMHTLFRGMLPQHFFLEKPAIPFDGAWNATQVERMIAQLRQHQHEIAAVIVEPVFQGGNAMWFYHPNYLRALREACDELGLLLIFDEIATGFGRTGTCFAFEHAQVLPDIITVGKILTGGAITLAAAIASDEVATTICSTAPGAFMHGPTYMGNPLACAAACASLNLLRTTDWQSNVLRIEAELRDQLSAYRHHPNIKDVRVLGAIGVLELKVMPPPEQVQRIVRETGVWLRPFDGYLYTMPPFITSSEEIRQITTAMGRLLDRIQP